MISDEKLRQQLARVFQQFDAAEARIVQAQAALIEMRKMLDQRQGDYPEALDEFDSELRPGPILSTHVVPDDPLGR